MGLILQVNQMCVICVWLKTGLVLGTSAPLQIVIIVHRRTPFVKRECSGEAARPLPGRSFCMRQRQCDESSHFRNRELGAGYWQRPK